jgi:hypothetical protein
MTINLRSEPRLYVKICVSSTKLARIHSSRPDLVTGPLDALIERPVG